jgi:SNW domain-containing protein 1
MSLAKLLPKPTQLSFDPKGEEKSNVAFNSLVQPTAYKEPPPYGHRKGWTPRSIEDYGDGGAFPEIHVGQYPRNMGKNKTTTSKAIVPLQLDSSGKVKYDLIAKLGHDKGRVRSY